MADTIIWVLFIGLSVFFALATVAALYGAVVSVKTKNWDGLRAAAFAACVAAIISYSSYGCRKGDCNLDGDSSEYRRI